MIVANLDAVEDQMVQQEAAARQNKRLVFASLFFILVIVANLLKSSHGSIVIQESFENLSSDN